VAVGFNTDISREIYLGRLFNPAVQGRLSLPLRSNPNFVAITTCSWTGASAEPTSSSFVNAP
jgi:hypothetical protein